MRRLYEDLKAEIASQRVVIASNTVRVVLTDTQPGSTFFVQVALEPPQSSHTPFLSVLNIPLTFVT